MLPMMLSGAAPATRHLARMLVAPLVAVIVISGTVANAAEADFVQPVPELAIEGIPPLPRALERATARYGDLRGMSLLGWHPERTELLVLRRAQQSVQAFRIDKPGAAPEQLTDLAEPVTWASWPPRPASWLVIAHSVGGNEQNRLLRFDLNTRALTPLSDPGRRVESISWARPDRGEGATDLLAYSVTTTGRALESTSLTTEIRAVDPLRPDSDRLIARLPGTGWSVSSVAPDRKTFVITESRSITESYLWTLDVATATRKLLTPLREDTTSAWRGATFDVTGDRVFALTDRGSEFFRLVALDPATREHKVLASHDWSVDGFELSDDGKRLAYRTNEDGTSVLRVLDLASGRELSLPRIPGGVIGRFAWHGGQQRLAFTLSWARDPASVHVIDIDAGTVVRWSAAPVIDTAQFVEPELVRWKSFDGREISGYLYLPPAKFTGRRPVKMILHGGPEAQTRPSFLGRHNYLVNEEGVALLLPNVRGSSGYGRTFVGLDDGRKREDSVRDAAAAFEYIAAHPRLDASRILVSGGSYGGYMSLALATLYPERIACAISEVGIANFVSFLERTESYRRDLRRREYGDERDPEMRAFLESISPLHRADRIRRPLFVIHGANDPRVPVSEAESIVSAVRKAGQTVWSLIARNEGHGFAREANARYRHLAAVAFARQCLAPDKSP